MEQVRGRQFELPGNAGRLVVRAEELSANPALVWQPCRESLSPFYPFRMILHGAHRLFVRVYDGAVFTALTNDLGGL
jgi:hypothetical protein